MNLFKDFFYLMFLIDTKSPLKSVQSIAREKLLRNVHVKPDNASWNEEVGLL